MHEQLVVNLLVQRLFMLHHYKSTCVQQTLDSYVGDGFPGHTVNLLINLYRKQKAKIRVAGTLSRGFRVKRGVRQGCVLSPYLFNILAEMVMREVLEGYKGGFQIGGRRVTNLRYADDIILLACSEIQLQELVDLSLIHI